MVTDDTTGLFTWTITQAQWVSVGQPNQTSIAISNTQHAPGSFFGLQLNMTCFGAGTQIATPTGETSVESLQIGDLIRTADGRDVPVRWIGRQTVDTVFTPDERLWPVEIKAGALGIGQPNADLTVTADHGMLVDGLIINAGALVNGTSIRRVGLADRPAQTAYYHVETEDHEVIVANGAPTESFLDVVSRRNFENYQEYLDLYGTERIIKELSMPRISAARLVPQSIKDRIDRADVQERPGAA